MYDPTVGRFLSEDPIGFDGQDANKYRYVHNSPLNATDPTGLAENPGNPPSPYARPKVYICERPAQVIGGNLIGAKHQWIVIVYPDGTIYSAGMGNAQGVPGQNGQTLPDCPYSQTGIRDHSSEPFVNPKVVPQANPDRLRRQLEIGTPTGRWVPGVNDCNTFVKEKIEKSSPATKPPPWTELPAALSPEYRQQLYRAWFDPDYDGFP
ncbi:MAG: RHS repeat-associated core domain-containing protein [Thermoguttaceae bacterium]